MANRDNSIDLRILTCAKEEFLSKPYEKVSLREVCSKAGVTTGAFYKRYKNKEELFDAVVEETVALVRMYCDQTEAVSYERMNDDELRKIWEMTPETQSRTINMLYDNYDGFRLLLCHAEGTKYAGFLHDFVTDVSDRSYRFTEEAYRRGMTPLLIDEEELHMLLSAYLTACFEPILHDYDAEKTDQYLNTLQDFFMPGWMKIMGIEN